MTEFNPPHRILLGPGPSEVAPSVLRAMSAPMVGHLDPYFLGLLDETKELMLGSVRLHLEGLRQDGVITNEPVNASTFFDIRQAS